jgi:hypothetical protein
MFDWIKGKNKMLSNAVPFPERKEIPETPEAVKEPRTYFTFGLTDDNRVSFSMGFNTLTMNAVGAQQLIDQLEFYKNRLDTEK